MQLKIFIPGVLMVSAALSAGLVQGCEELFDAYQDDLSVNAVVHVIASYNPELTIGHPNGTGASGTRLTDGAGHRGSGRRDKGMNS